MAAESVREHPEWPLLPTILEQVANGDSSAVERCIDEYGGLVYRLARRYLDREPSEVEDAVQDVFIEIWLNAKRFDASIGTEPAFVATIAHRRIIDRQRQITSRRRTERKASTAAELTPNWKGMLEEGGIDASRVYREELAESLGKLPRDEQIVVWLSVYRGLSHRQISQTIGAPVGTIKTRLRRAMLTMTKSIMDQAVQSTGLGGGQ